MVKLPHSKHTSILLDICHHYIDSSLFFLSIFKAEFKITNGNFQITNQLTNSAIPLKINCWNTDKKISYPAIHIYICLLFHFDF